MKSIVSYPDRGPYGNARWRGNCSGRLVKDLLEFFTPRLFVDPMVGGQTSADVAKEMGVRFVGLDLHSGFNIVRDNLLAKVGEHADYVFLHPPYHSMIPYSGGVWGDRPHPDDLSRCGTPEEFLEKMQLALYNVCDALQGSGHYSILIGDLRSQGRFWSIQADLIKMAPGILESLVIKEQHNCRSSGNTYNGKLIPIVHEYLLNFRKDRVVFGVLDAAVSTSQSLVTLANATWKAVIEWTLRKLGGKASLNEIYGAVAENAQERTRLNPNWQAKIRQVLQKYAFNVERGVWRLREA